MASCYYYIHLETDIQRVASYPQVRRAEYSLGISESARQRLHMYKRLPEDYVSFQWRRGASNKEKLCMRFKIF